MLHGMVSCHNDINISRQLEINSLIIIVIINTLYNFTFLLQA